MAKEGRKDFNRDDFKSELRWKDNRRIMLFVPWVDSYEVCDEKLVIETGLLRKTRNVTMLYRILDIELTQGFFQRLFNLGDIILHTNDKADPEVILKGVEDPIMVMDLILDLTEASRERKGVRYSEFSM